jgi:hypothetical protein
MVNYCCINSVDVVQVLETLETRGLSSKLGLEEGAVSGMEALNNVFVQPLQGNEVSKD